MAETGRKASGRPGRDKAATRSELLKAVGRLLARDGFGSLGVNAVAREAGVDKVLIYRYFGGLDALLREFGQSGDFWPTIEEIVGTGADSLEALTVPDRWATLLARYAEALRNRPVTKEILAWEQIERNDLTLILQEARQRWFTELITLFAADPAATDADLETTVLLIVAGIHYFVVRGRLQSDFSGVVIDSDAGWQRLNDVIRTICEQTLKPTDPSEERPWPPPEPPQPTQPHRPHPRNRQRRRPNRPLRSRRARPPSGPGCDQCSSRHRSGC